MSSLQTWTLRVLALLFGGVFVYAGAVKLDNPILFLEDVRSYDILRDPYAAWLAISLPWLEIFAGVAVVTGAMRMSGLLLLNASLLAFLGALWWSWHRGLNIQCGCFGEGARGEGPNWPWLFARDILLLATGLLLMWLEKRAHSPKFRTHP